MNKLYLLALLFAIAINPLFSQVTTSNIKGVVTDTQNEPLPGASVVAVHTPTGTNYGTATNFDGRFNLLNLRVGGPYTVTISYIGFQTQEITDVYLDLGQTTDLELVLIDDSQQLDEVVVTGDRSGTFDADRTGAETNVGRRELTRLPTISRSAQDFTRLEPTASGNSFAGRNDQFNNFSLDGAVFSNPFGLDAATPGGQTDAQPISLDAIDQIQVAVAPYDVTQSGFTGASVNAVTKSGTNEFYGTVYGFFRNEDLTGGKIKGEKLIKPKLEQNQYGVSIGGPIIKNKLFFFANFEKDERTDLGTFGFVPNSGTGAVNESRVQEEDLMTVQNALAGLGYDTGRYQGFTYGAESIKGIIKLDWNIDDDNRLAFIYNFLDASKEKPAHPTAIAPRGPSFATLQFENSGYEINNRIQSFQLELNSTISDAVVNKLQSGYTYFDDFRNPMSTPAPVITIQDGSGQSYIIAGHEPFSINNKLDQKVFQITDNLNYFVGDHTLTAGFSIEKFEFKNSFNLAGYDNFAPPYYGTFSPYPDLDTFLADAADPDGALVRNLASAQAAHDSRNEAGDGNDGGWKLSELSVGQLAFYVQDEWNLTDDFKLTYGIRFDKPLYFNTEDLIQKYIDTDNGANRDTSIPYYDPETGEEVFLSSTTLPDNNFLMSPRLGFNWDVYGDNNFKLRGGTGIFTGRFPFVWLGNQVSGADDGFFQLVDPDFKWPQVWRNSLGADYRFEDGLVLTADFSYTKDINGIHVQNWGLREPSQNLNAPGDQRALYTADDMGNNAYVFTNTDKGRVWNATFKAQKTFYSGLYTSFAYSYLNAKDVNSIEAEITGDAFDFNPVVGNANNDVLAYSKYGDTHRFIGVISKQFKYGGDKWATTISAFAEYAKGGRFNYTYGGNINGDSSFQNNDLLYIPTTEEVQQMQFTGDATQQAGQAAAFEAYIQQDDYMSDNRGKYMERYGALAPWRSRWDVKILQDYNFKVAGDKTNTIQLSIDILNVGNLINSDWGVIEQPRSLNPISVTDIDANNVPTYSFDTSLTSTFGPLSDIASRWQAQVGLRYIFN
ncbi:carboxypeptidase regulatory-like domain-containing protein [Galbibacter sp. EGI 63066]|uniref:TonB-dependent receptor n=1 Tax=Galbibacter sp. EGI 63066 TaxID=2993559 RepID=UPI0022492A03|nr:carboxypeptidase regulatory-like domain-containing protein [Galbibacter sp. EGI 63066]MCX2679209.1 carboxypeptidase regulatory-like domain-containing protein [Galbibacter sp. EGI 63066]